LKERSLANISCQTVSLMVTRTWSMNCHSSFTHLQIKKRLTERIVSFHAVEYTGRDSVLDKAQAWLATYTEQHKSCRTDHGRQYYPPRLLSTESTDKVRLVETSNALSHRTLRFIASLLGQQYEPFDNWQQTICGSYWTVSSYKLYLRLSGRPWKSQHALVYT
jgi:hypothetical protein